MRVYSEEVDPTLGDVFSVEDWLSYVAAGSFNNYDGSGYWAKGNYQSKDEVFSTPPEDATHVVWYNK